MTRKHLPIWGFVIAALGFGSAALIRVLKGDGFNGTFVVLALVFAAMGVTLARRSRAGDSRPPTA